MWRLLFSNTRHTQPFEYTLLFILMKISKQPNHIDIYFWKVIVINIVYTISRKTYPHKVSGTIYLPAKARFIAFFLVFHPWQWSHIRSVRDRKEIFYTNKYRHLRKYTCNQLIFFISSIQYKICKQIIIFILFKQLPVVLKDSRY